MTSDIGAGNYYLCLARGSSRSLRCDISLMSVQRRSSVSVSCSSHVVFASVFCPCPSAGANTLPTAWILALKLLANNLSIPCSQRRACRYSRLMRLQSKTSCPSYLVHGTSTPGRLAILISPSHSTKRRGTYMPKFSGSSKHVMM